LGVNASTHVQIVTKVSKAVAVVTNVAYLKVIGGESSTIRYPEGGCGSDGAGSDCGGTGPAVPLHVHARKASSGIAVRHRTTLVGSARTSSKAVLTEKVTCRNANGAKVSGCNATTDARGKVKVRVTSCKVRRVTVAVVARPTVGYADDYSTSIWTRTWRVKGC
jgi:hypothetical protein